MAKLTLAAVGDMSFKGLGELTAANGPGFAFEHVIDSLRSADIRFGNQESVMFGADFPADQLSPRALCSGDNVAESLATAEFDVLHMASNHVLDCGWRGLLHTYDKIVEIGSQPLGAGPSAGEAGAMRIVERDGATVGFLGYLEPCNWVLSGGGGRVSLFNLPDALYDIARCRDQVDTLVVSLHAGLEFQDGPSMPRVQACRQMIDAGTDLVLCHHPHVPQGIERHGGGLIAYSLGNFIFPITTYLKDCGGPNVYRSTILFVDIVDGKISDFRREDYRIDGDKGRPCPLDAAGADEAAAHHAMLDGIVADEDRLRQAWYASCRQYLRQHWDQMVQGGPDEFIEQIGWRILGLTEATNWTAGVFEMAKAEYKTQSTGDFEFVRPNAPFEQG